MEPRSCDRADLSRHAEGQLIKTGRAHSCPTYGSDGPSIVDPRATVCEEKFSVQLKDLTGRIGHILDDRNLTRERAIDNHGDGVERRSRVSEQGEPSPH